MKPISTRTDSTPEQLCSFWESQLSKLGKLVQDSELALVSGMWLSRMG